MNHLLLSPETWIEIFTAIRMVLIGSIIFLAFALWRAKVTTDLTWVFFFLSFVVSMGRLILVNFIGLGQVFADGLSTVSLIFLFCFVVRVFLALKSKFGPLR